MVCIRVGGYIVGGCEGVFRRVGPRECRVCGFDGVCVEWVDVRMVHLK